jgi:hypothetical protein
VSYFSPVTYLNQKSVPHPTYPSRHERVPCSVLVLKCFFFQAPTSCPLQEALYPQARLILVPTYCTLKEATRPLRTYLVDRRFQLRKTAPFLRLRKKIKADQKRLAKMLPANSPQLLVAKVLQRYMPTLVQTQITGKK